MNRFHMKTSATVKRLGAYSGNKSTFASVAGTIYGFFTPMENTQKAASLGIIGQAYEYTTDGTIDIRVNDILTINSIDYGVAGVARFILGSQDFLKVTLQLIKNG